MNRQEELKAEFKYLESRARIEKRFDKRMTELTIKHLKAELKGISQ